MVFGIFSFLEAWRALASLDGTGVSARAAGG